MKNDVSGETDEKLPDRGEFPTERIAPLVGIVQSCKDDAGFANTSAFPL